MPTTEVIRELTINRCRIVERILSATNGIDDVQAGGCMGETKGIGAIAILLSRSHATVTSA
jgi:hypothetical protein